MTICTLDLAYNAVHLINHNIIIDFWYEVKRIRSNKTLPCNIVDNVSNAPGTADFFADKYEDLYSCIGFCATEMDNIRKDIDSLSVSAGYDSNCVFTSLM